MFFRPFTTDDATRVIETHTQTLEMLKSTDSMLQSYLDDIKESTDHISEKEAQKILKDIPVEEINRDKKGIRVKLLRESGYESVLDLIKTPISHLSSINGISENIARRIKDIADGIALQAKDSANIRLSVDDQTPDTTQLVRSLLQYKWSKDIVEECQRLLASNQERINSAIEDIKATSGWFKWFFSSGEKKQRAVDSYNYLEGLLDDSYMRDSKAHKASLDNIQDLTASEAWTNFSRDPIRFVNILDEVQPGILGSGDGLYGLPEDLAQEIRDECFFPEGLLCSLRPYQEWGVRYALHQEKILLGDEMGLGKTIQAIAVMVSLKNTGATHFMVVCPASVVTNWCREIEKMSRLRPVKVHGPNKDEAFRQWIQGGGVAVTTYETTKALTLPKDFKFSMLVVDEAHYIKNPKAQRSANVKKLTQNAERLMFMTGTALENKVGEMIELIKLLQPSVAKDLKGKEALSTAPLFRKLVAPVYYRRKREEVLTELPELIETKEWCSMNSDEEEAYEEAVLSENFMQARRVSWNVSDVNLSSKAQRLLDIVKEAESEGRKVLVFSFFLDTIDKVATLLGNRCLTPITGAISAEKRQQIIDEFDKAPAGTVLPSQITAGGIGLNIQSASVVVICEPQFKPSTESQAISRAYRMGQARNVLVYRLLSENTIDERITDVLENKQAIFDAFADQSVAAQQSKEVDERTFGKIVEDEIQRIKAKQQTRMAS